MARAGVLTVSDRCSQGVAMDTSGPGLVDIINNKLGINDVLCECIPDDLEAIQAVLVRWSDSLQLPLILTTGGTGFSPRDHTPEATQPLLDRPAPGIVVAMVTKSLSVTPMAMLSRPAAGIRNKSLIVNLPGSSKASSECLNFILPSLPHALALLGNDTTAVDAVHSRPLTPPHPLIPASRPLTPASRPRSSPYPMVSVEDALSFIMSNAHTLPVRNTCLTRARGKVLGQEVRASRPHPPFPASMKDGYAVLSTDQSDERKVLFASAAGELPGAELSAGFVSRITTGGVVPRGADAVVQVEDTQLVASDPGGQELEVRILTSVSPGHDVRPVGSDIQAGQLVLEAGATLNPPEIGLLASLGLSQVPVVKAPTVAVLSTGNEVVEAGEDLKDGCVYDSNRPALMAAVAQAGGSIVDLGIAQDTRASLVGKLRQALSVADIVISSGGVSMGELDLLKPVLEQDFQAKIHFGRVLMKPGKPSTFATVQWNGATKLVFALPGNPVSCLVSFSVLVLPAMLKMSGSSRHGLRRIQVKLGEGVALDRARPEFHRVQLDWSGGVPVALSTGVQRSSQLASLRQADALLELPQGREDLSQLAQGAMATALLLP